MPEDMARRQYIFSTIRRVFERFGFRPLETPAFESWELLGAKGGGGDAMKDEVYVFKDKGGRELGLRFDLTVPTARVVASNPQLAWPFKRYQTGRVWRYDNPQAGRFREFWQSDVDVFGSASMAAEAECIAALAACLKELGFEDFEVRLNNRKILNGMVEAAGMDKKQAPSALRSLDKLEKIGEGEVLRELIESGKGIDESRRLLRLTKLGGGAEALNKAKKMLKGIREAEEGIAELEEILRLSAGYGTSKAIRIDFSLVRGLDYYTGPIYEIADSESKIGSVGGGGRYDRLVELYGGRPTPATGGSLGVERIYEIMLAEGMLDSVPTAKARIFVAAVGDDKKTAKAAISISQKLRSAGIPAETDLMARKLGQCLEYANKMGIHYVLVVGEKELASGRLTLRDMRDGKQRSMELAQVLETLGC